MNDNDSLVNTTELIINRAELSISVGIIGLMKWKKLSATNGFLEIRNQLTDIIILVN